MPALPTLSLLYLASPALPIGAFAYSQGLAAAIELGWVRDAQGLEDWLDGVLEHGLTRLDLPALVRLMEAAGTGDAAGLARWNARVLAARETAELVLEEIQLGKSLHRLLRDQDLLPPIALPDSPGYVALFALAAHALGIGPREACQGFAWSWLENQVAVAGKAIPLGQTAGQRVLLALLPSIERAAAQARTIEDHEMGGSLPGLALASSLHETQYSRLFRS